MRKFVLISVMATMSTTSCYANLSLASYDPTPMTIVEQKPQTVEIRQEQTMKSSVATKPKKKHLPEGARSAGRVDRSTYPAHDINQQHCH